MRLKHVMIYQFSNERMEVAITRDTGRHSYLLNNDKRRAWINHTIPFHNHVDLMGITTVSYSYPDIRYEANL